MGSIGQGGALESFLRAQDQETAQKLYQDALATADRMIDGYFSAGLDNTNTYPGWMPGYWTGISVACDLDNLLGTPFSTWR